VIFYLATFFASAAMCLMKKAEWSGQAYDGSLQAFKKEPVCTNLIETKLTSKPEIQ
jgi:hypothetical protein